jgi:hypothetical protein
MAFPTYSMLSVILGSTILVLTWVASNKMKKCAAEGVHTNLQILMMVGTANVVLGFTGLLDHAAVKSAQIVNMVYIFAIGVITMVSSIFLLTNANAKENNPDGDTEDKKEGCESVDTEAMILAVIGGIIVLGFVSKVLEYWKAEQEVSSSELKQKQAAARAAKKQADLLQQKADQQLTQQAHELEMQTRKNNAIMRQEADEIAKLEAKSRAISVDEIGAAEAARKRALIQAKEEEARNVLKEAQQTGKELEEKVKEAARRQELALKLHEKTLSDAKLDVVKSRSALEQGKTMAQAGAKALAQVQAGVVARGGGAAFRMKKGKKGKKGKKPKKRSSRKAKKAKKSKKRGY